MKTYLVGGAVRDALLDLPVYDRDWLVVGADDAQMVAQGFVRKDPDFPVYLHPKSGEEYALARRETKTGDGYRGFVMDYAPDVTLEEDLQRRDLTINALVQNEAGELIDLFDGQEDLQQGYLRHITPAFSEDPVRILRIARFAAKLGQFGFRVSHPTHRVLKQMVIEGAVAELQPQRVWQEMLKALQTPTPWRFFEVLNACGALQQILPGLAACMHQAVHADKKAVPVIAALQCAARLNTSAAVRLAALLLQASDDVAVARQQLSLEKPFALLLEQTRSLWSDYQQLDSGSVQGVAEFIRVAGGYANDDRFERLLLVYQAQNPEDQRVALLRKAAAAGQAVSASALRDQGLQGADLGQALQAQRASATELVWQAA